MALSCLYSNNSIQCAKNPRPCPTETEPVRLSSRDKKTALTLASNVDRIVSVESKSINHVAFLTLTFQENIQDHKEAYSRFRSFNSNFLAPHPVYGHWISVKEHQARGAWHYHMIIQLTEDIRTGFDFDQYDKWLKGPRKVGTFPTGNAQLRALWVELGQVLNGYGFGKIFTLEPIKSNKEAIKYYVGKYVSKQIGQRSEADKGARLVNYSKGWLKNSVQMAWFNDNSTLWRQKVAIFARLHGCQEMYQLSEKLGSDWAYRYTQDIVDIEIVPERFKDEAYGPERIYQNKLIPEMEEKADIRLRSDWNKHAVDNFEFADPKRQAALKQKVAMRSADSSRNRKNQKARIKVQLDMPRAKNPPPGLLEEIKNQVAQDRLEYPTRKAKSDKDSLIRHQHAREGRKLVEQAFGGCTEEVKEVGIIPF